ncbi:double-stranded RNA-binding protein Staufen homolog isoform X2 [Babylonia areolata]|uniref:double-stranded RNA-binding protein Staufen homolog isoform X2 n=1 Tax=Babylonia areolata TaxID=304850 RepID=UPI003FD29275
MSQMLNSAGGSPQGAGYHSVTQSHTAVTANPSNILSMSTAARSSPLSLSSSQHYGQLSSAQQHHHQLMQQQQHQQLQQQQQLQTQQQQLQQQPKLQPPVKVLSNPQSQFQQQQQLQMGGGAGTPILGSGGGTTYRSVLRRSHHTSPTTAAGTGSPVQPMVGDSLSDGAVGGAVGLDTGGVGVAQADAEQEQEPGATSTTLSKDEKENSNLANTKEKTPMCLINELARFNKVNHQYTLVDEQGPAHKKTFFVKLKLGEEEYSAQGESIKKAQHAAAAIALTETQFSHPSPKPQRSVEGEASNVTPTVELNALAMKRGEPAIYKLIEPRNQNYTPPNIDFRGMYNQRYHYGRPPRPFYVMLKVGTKEYIGEGPTRQQARHNAATKALKVLRNLPILTEASKAKTEEELESEDAMKSEISLVHEIALKRNLPVIFDVVRESGPPHMKNFVTKCTVGDLTTEAEGNSKKLSKKRAAELMLEELKKLPNVPVVVKSKIKPNSNKKKNRNIIKVQKADPSYGVGVNPISRLIQIMQAQKKKEPVYNLVAEKGLPRRREFVMQCQVEEHTSEGVGPNKKLAKRSAAESMLQILGFSRPSPQPTKPAIKNTQSSEGGSSSDKKVTFVDTGKSGGDSGEKSSTTSTNTTSTGCQVVPGLLRLNHAGAAHVPGLMTSSPAHTFSGTAESVSSVLSKAGPQAEKQAMALAEFMNIPMKFEEFTKSNSGAEYLTRVTLSTHPPQVYHGTGPTRETSRDAAALSTIQNLLSLATNFHSSAGDASSHKAEIGVTALPHQLNGAGDQV